MNKIIITVALLLLSVPSFASINGINGFVTPQTLTSGTGTLTYQQENPQIGNQNQGKLEYGLTNRLDVEGTYAFSPRQESLNGEYEVIQSKITTVSVGFLNYNSDGSKPDPFVEAGFVNGRTNVFGGYLFKYHNAVNDFRHDTSEALAGIAYTVDVRTKVQINYQTGRENFTAAGVNYTIIKNVSLNPAVEWNNHNLAPKYFGGITLTF